jgi:hypothetical protein
MCVGRAVIMILNWEDTPKDVYYIKKKVFMKSTRGMCVP